MKILWLSAGLLLPLDKGGKLRTWHLMRHLARRHGITVLAYVDPETPPEHLAGMSEVCRTLVTITRKDVPKSGARFLVDAAAHLVRRLPYAIGKYRSAEYRRQLEGLLATGFDLVVCDFLMPAANVPPRLPCPAVLFTHNVEAEIWRRHAETARSPLRKALLTTQWRRMLRFEREAVRRFDLVLAVSERDRRTIVQLYGPLEQPIRVVPTGVDAAYFAEVTTRPVRPRHLVFTGSMDWLPNEDGMLYFVREVLPLIRREEPSATLSIVGRAPTPAVLRLGAEYGIEVTGRVDDVRPHMAAAAIYVVPLRIGGGTRLKIFEAMAMGKPVVSTSIGAEGLPLEPGTNVLLADSAGDFAAAVVRLFRNDSERMRIGDAGRQLVTERYDWSSVFGHLEQALEAATARGPRHDAASASLPELECQARN